nr:uncharacterized protein LOC126548603 isoform X2 [Dermacentor andersoni]
MCERVCAHCAGVPVRVLPVPAGRAAVDGRAVSTSGRHATLHPLLGPARGRASAILQYTCGAPAPGRRGAVGGERGRHVAAVPRGSVRDGAVRHAGAYAAVRLRGRRRTVHAAHERHGRRAAHGRRRRQHGAAAAERARAGSSEATIRLIHKWSSSQHGRGVDRESLPKLANAKYVNSWVLDFLIDTNVTDDQLMNHEVSRASAPCSTETGEESARRHSPPKQPVAPSKSSFLSLPRVSRRLKKTSILEDGQVVMPGQSSPERKGIKSIDPGSASL